ncbi:MAG: tetratricopeptide repeat protein [Calditrichaceae bacterium]|nr:tetratricopeptide repeat protein [Calditrichaceae bacterium]
MNILKNNRILFVIISALFSIGLISSVYAQEKEKFAFGDTLFKRMTIDDLINIREYYGDRVHDLRKDEDRTFQKGMELGESFLGERGENITNRDKLYIRIAEYYIDKAYADFEDSQVGYEEQYKEYEKQYELFEKGQLEQEPAQPQFPKVDYTKPIEIYDRLMNEYPSSDYADDALYSKAWLLERMGRGGEGRRIYQEVIDKYPDSPFAPEAYIQLAEYFFNPREDKTDEEENVVELQKAIQLYKKVLKYRDSKRYDEALYKLGWSYYKLAAREPEKYNDAISYFMAVADDIERAKELDPRSLITNVNVRDEAIEYVGISFTDESYTTRGVDKAREMLMNIGDRPYGPEIMQAIGQTYQKIDEKDKAIYAFENLLDMYPRYRKAPAMQKEIVDALYALGRDKEAYDARTKLYQTYGPKSEWYKDLEISDEKDRLTNIEAAYNISEQALRTNLLIDLQDAQEMDAEGTDGKPKYEDFAKLCEIYLDIFAADSNAYSINWNYAIALDGRLGRLEQAYEEYIRVSNDYLETTYQQNAALNAVSIADSLVKLKYGRKDTTVTFDFADLAKLSPESLTPEETRLIEAYDNYIRLFPSGQYTPNFLAAAGGIYYNHKKFAEAKVYYQTLVKRFPGAEEKSLAMQSIMDSYFALGKFRDSEVIAKRIIGDPNISSEQKEFASKRMAAAIFKNAEYLQEQGDYFAAANEFVRVYTEAPDNQQYVEPALYNGGLNFEKAKDWIRAIETFNIIATNFPKSKYAVNSLERMADDYIELKQYGDAAATYERVFTNYREHQNAEASLYNASFYYKKGKEWQNAINANNTYIATYPDQAFAVDLFFDNADLYLKLDNVTEANRIYDEFSRRYPDDPRTVTAFYERGRYYMENGMNDLAKEEFNKAIARSEQFRREGKDPNAFIAGEAVNSLGEILHKEFLAIELKQPQSNVDYQLDKMRSLLKELNDTYKKVLSFGSPRSFEATYNVARSYEEFADVFITQEIDPNLPEDKEFVEQKRVNDQAAALYDNAVEQYKEVVTNIPVIAERLGVDMWAEKDTAAISEPIAEADTTVELSGIRRAAEEDSTRQLARLWHQRAQDKISSLLYTKASLTQENVYQAVNIKAPGQNPIYDITYKLAVIQKVATPAIQQSIEAHIRNINEAEQMNLSNKYVEESKRQILLTSNILGQELEHLIDDIFREYNNTKDEIKVMVGREFEAVNAQGLDYYGLDNNASQLIDFSKIISLEIINSYINTLQLAQDNNIKNDLIKNTEERMLRFTMETTDKMETLGTEAKKLSEGYRTKFDSTENYNYDDASNFFDNYYYNFNDYSKELMETAYQAKETYGIKNLWASKLMLKLINIDPLLYSGGVDKDSVFIYSDQSWKSSIKYYPEVWPKNDFDDSNWSNAIIVENYSNQFYGLNVNPKAIWVPMASAAPAPIDSFGTGAAMTEEPAYAVTDTMMAADSLGGPVASQLVTTVEAGGLDTLAFFRKSFALSGTPVAGAIYVTADDDFRIYLNGEYMIDDESNSYNVVDTLDFYTIEAYLLPEKQNVIAIDVEDKDLTRGGLKIYGYVELIPSDITAAAEEKAKVQKVFVDPVVLKKVNTLNKNRISLNPENRE